MEQCLEQMVTLVQQAPKIMQRWVWQLLSMYVDTFAVAKQMSEQNPSGARDSRGARNSTPPEAIPETRF